MSANTVHLLLVLTAAHACCALVSTVVASPVASMRPALAFRSFSGDNKNLRNTRISGPLSLNITVKFTVDTKSADVSCTPTVDGGYVYFGDWSGSFYKVDAVTGEVAWRVNVTQLVWPPDGEERPTNLLVTRTSPALADGLALIGTQSRVGPGRANGTQCFLMAINVTDGSRVWRFDAHEGHPYAIHTASVTVHQGVVYGSTSSSEEQVDGLGLPCCNFRGAVYAVRLYDGELLWRWYAVPENGGQYGGWSGNAVWGSQPAIDAKRRLVYIATGQLYTVPPDVEECLAAATDPAAQASCLAVEGNWFNAVVALDMDNGELAWGRRMSYMDVWTLACYTFVQGGQCNFPESPDYDFAQDPLYLPNTKCGNKTVDIIVAAQKSGAVYGFNAHMARQGGDVPFRLRWTATTGAASEAGGSQWGSASDGRGTVFLQNANRRYTNVTLVNPAPDGPTWTMGGFATAVDACTGEIKWQAAVPYDQTDETVNLAETSLLAPPTYIRDVSSPDGAGYVVYPTMNRGGLVVVFRADTGARYTNFLAGPGSIISGASVANNTLYIGVGYRRFGGEAGAESHGMAAFNLL